MKPGGGGILRPIVTHARQKTLLVRSLGRERTQADHIKQRQLIAKVSVFGFSPSVRPNVMALFWQSIGFLAYCKCCLAIGGYSEATARLQWGYSESCGHTAQTHMSTSTMLRTSLLMSVSPLVRLKRMQLKFPTQSASFSLSGCKPKRGKNKGWHLN